MTLVNTLQFDPATHVLHCIGQWDLQHLSLIQSQLNAVSITQTESPLIINGEAVTQMDSAGAYLLTQWKQKIQVNYSIEVEYQHFPHQMEQLLHLVEKEKEESPTAGQSKKPNVLGRFGLMTTTQLQQLLAYFSFIGLLTHDAFRLIRNGRLIRLNALSQVIYKSGYQALPIIALLSFMIGIVITYQMGLQLKNYGANIFIVDLLGLSILREFAPLLTAIMVAGRTGSSFTAQLGMMKLSQEIDALNTIGVTPGELLLLPRILGLLIALPLLTIWGMLFGIMGGMIMANSMLQITWYDFLHRFPQVIPLKTLLIGLGKAPVFAFLIASISCFQGMQVRGDANSMGQNTTRSVVVSIFFIILVDAVFSILFSKLKL